MSKIKTSMWREYEKEASHKLFKPYRPWSLRYPSNWIKNISWFFRSFKYAAQRAKRGYSDYDLWDIGDYITGMSAQALEEFAEKTDSYPCRYMKFNKKEDTDEGAEVWKNEIKNCSGKLFVSLECLEDYNYDVPPMPGEMIIERAGGEVKVHSTATEEEDKAWLDCLREIRTDRTNNRHEAFLWLADHSEELWS